MGWGKKSKNIFTIYSSTNWIRQTRQRDTFRFLLHRLTYLDLAYFEHRRYILPPSQPIIADGETIFSGSIPRLFPPPLFPFFGFGFGTCFFCAHHEGTNQAPIATVRVYVSQTQQNSLQSGLHKAAKYIQQYVRVDQSATAHASRQEQVKCCREPPRTTSSSY